MKRYFILFVLLMLWGFPQQGYCQKSGYEELRKELSDMFSGINKENVPTGLLRDYAVEYENLDLFDPSRGLTDNNVVDVFTFGKVLKTIKSSSLKGNPISSFEKKVSQLNKRSANSKETKIAIALYQYAQIKANALKENHMGYKNGRVTSLSPEALQIRTMCAGCVLDNQKKTNDITFSVTKEYMLSNIGIKDVEVDFGAGYKDVLHNPTTAHLQNGKHTIKIKVTDKNNHVYLSHSSLTISKSENHLTTRSSVSTTITGQAYNGVTTSADVTWIKSPMNNSDKIKNPIIFVEGFDPRDMDPEGQGSMNYQMVSEELSRKTDSQFLKYMDIIYVDWQDAGEYLQANANTLIAVLNWVNSQLDSNLLPTILLGHSMGGIVARYALKTMENENIAHHVGLYISYDSPHLGANIPLGILYGYHGIMQFLKDKDILSSLARKFAGLDKLIALGDRYAYSTATQQMLVNYVDPAGHLNNSEHILWQKELKQLGFPQGDKGKSFKMLSVANSDYSAMSIPQKYIFCDFSAATDLGALVPFMPFLVGIGLQDVIAGLLNVLPGKDEISGTFECLPALTAGQKVTHINLRYKKDFLWVVPISKTVFSYDRYHSGSFLYDTYSSSLATDGLSLSRGDTLGIPLVYECGYGMQVDPKFAFIPTSSALACESENITPETFTQKPVGLESAFGENYYLEHGINFHGQLLSMDVLRWIESHVMTTVVGPSTGYTGAKYSLSMSAGDVTWTSSNTSVATIDQEGVLTTAGANAIGVTLVTGRNAAGSYSKIVLVGMPQYILSAKHEPDGFQVDASCANSQIKQYEQNVNQILRFEWGIKFPNKDIYWKKTTEPMIFIPLTDNSVNVFFKTIDTNGKESQPQSVQAYAPSVFYASYNNLGIDGAGNIYKENGSKYSYKNGTVYLTKRTDLPDEYRSIKWSPSYAEVYSPFSNKYTISVVRDEIAIKNILPQEEINYITGNAEAGKKYVYMLALKNSKSKIIQFIPVTFTFK